MKYKKILCYCIIVLSFGCFDIFKENSKNLIGNITLINSHNQEDKGYRMVLEEDSTNLNILTDYVRDAIGNDTIIIVHCITKNNCQPPYYKINHKVGEEPIAVDQITERNYIKLIKSFKTKYSFHDKLPVSKECP